MIPLITTEKAPLIINGRLDLLNTSCCDIHIQIIQADLNKNTSVAEETGKLIDLASRGEEQSADLSGRRMRFESKQNATKDIDASF